jgi:hypothetical protein
VSHRKPDATRRRRNRQRIKQAEDDVQLHEQRIKGGNGGGKADLAF